MAKKSNIFAKRVIFDYKQKWFLRFVLLDAVLLDKPPCIIFRLEFIWNKSLTEIHFCNCCLGIDENSGVDYVGHSVVEIGYCYDLVASAVWSVAFQLIRDGSRFAFAFLLGAFQTTNSLRSDGAKNYDYRLKSSVI